VAAAYYAAAHLGYALSFAGPVASIIWLPVGVGIAALYFLGPQLWPAVVVGDLLVNNYSALPLGGAIGQSFGNLLEILIGALLLHRLTAGSEPLGSIKGLAGVVTALVAGTLVSATIGLLSLYLAHTVTLDSVPRLWRTWWLGDLCGAMIVVPAAIAWSSAPRRPWFRGQMTEMALVVAVLLGLGTIAWQSGRPLYFVLPALTWAAVRFGPRGATLAIAVNAGFAIYVIRVEHGRFAFQTVGHTLLSTQVYILVSAVATLAVAALAREREQLAEGVRASRRRIVAAADEERRRIERNIHDGAQQRLVALAARLTLAAEQAQSNPHGAVESIESAQAELLLAIDELRELVQGIRPTVLRQFGLATAVQLTAARCGIPIELGELPAQRLGGNAEATAYYVVLEAITNAQRYASASVVHVSARLVSGRLELEISDDGIGGAVERDDLGLQGLRDRVEASGGKFTVESPLGEGTRISARIPASVVA